MEIKNIGWNYCRNAPNDEYYTGNYIEMEVEHITLQCM